MSSASSKRWVPGSWSSAVSVPFSCSSPGCGTPNAGPAPTASCAATSAARILLGLEVLIVADIVRTIIVDPTFESVAVLGAIVVIRILLSFSLEVEMDGMWPWNRWRRESPAP